MATVLILVGVFFVGCVAGVCSLLSWGVYEIRKTRRVIEIELAIEEDFWFNECKRLLDELKVAQAREDVEGFRRLKHQYNVAKKRYCEASEQEFVKLL